MRIIELKIVQFSGGTDVAVYIVDESNGSTNNLFSVRFPVRRLLLSAQPPPSKHTFFLA